MDRHSQSISTREKIGNLCKRVICYLLENKRSYHSLKEVISLVGGDQRKIVDVIFILEGVGLLTRISKNKFIFTGFRGMIQRLIDFVKQRLRRWKRYSMRFDLLTDDMIINGKNFPIKSSVYFGKFVSSILCKILLDSNKVIGRAEVESLFEENLSSIKEMSAKNIINDAILLLTSLNFVDKNESNDSITWVGPECINSAGLTMDNVRDIPNFESLLKPKNVNFESKEFTFFRNLLKEEISSNKLNLKQELFSKDQQNEAPTKDPNSKINLYHFNNFEPGGYALLKGRDWQHIMTKPHAIIGRSQGKDPNSKSKKFRWEVDVDLNKNNQVSRQHAVILYNYEEGGFEIKCLSKKNPVKVGNYSYDFKDKACPLPSKSMVTIGGEVFYFYLPNFPREKIVKKGEEEDEESKSMLKKEESEMKKEEDDDDDDEDANSGDGKDNKSQSQSQVKHEEKDDDEDDDDDGDDEGKIEPE